MQREFITPEQDPEAVVGLAVQNLRQANYRLLTLARDPATREHVLRAAADIQLAHFDLAQLDSFTRSRLPTEAA